MPSPSFPASWFVANPPCQVIAGATRQSLLAISHRLGRKIYGSAFSRLQVSLSD
jgi:hypothetical protein